MLLGQDIEDPKGGVFGVTKGLSTDFLGRVINSALSESTIVGTCIGRAFAGQRPVAFIQFADFLPLALNQILNELSTMHWRTNGDWQAPVTIIAAAGGYRAGTGPFHSATYDSLLSQAPGVDLFFPSRPDTMAGAWEHARQSDRPTIILYPKSILNDNSRQLRIQSSVVEAAKIRSGEDITVVSWGSCTSIAEQAVDAISKQSAVTVDLFELTCLSPLDLKHVTQSVLSTRRLLVVHEDFVTCGLGAEILAQISESISGDIQVARLARNSFLPCNRQAHLNALPSVESIIERVALLTNHDVTWSHDSLDNGPLIVRAMGASPSDHQIMILDWKVEPGQTVIAGQPLAELEAEKATFELASPADGNVIETLAIKGDFVSVGAPLITINTHQIQSVHSSRNAKQIRFQFQPQSKPQRASAMSNVATNTQSQNQEQRITGLARMSRPAVATGSGTLHNEALANKAAKWDDQQIFKRVGIRSRPVVSQDEDVVSLATSAAQDALQRSGLALQDLQSVICSTTTEKRSTPSVACDVLKNLLRAEGQSTTGNSFFPAAVDINAACSGFLYGLQQAFDQVAHDCRPVLLLTSEVITPMINYDDPSTAYVFGDAATATLIFPDQQGPPVDHTLQFSRPVLATVPDLDESLQADLHELEQRKLFMDGVVVARAAKRAMSDLSEIVCQKQGLSPDELGWVIAHQANQRILDGVAWNLGIPKDQLLSTLETTGNTSSSSIPTCLKRHWQQVVGADKPSLLTAFGAGYTVGSTLVYGPTNTI